ncbi:ribonuclease E inhibitor RraB [Algoriella sp.]|uniref:ribonuclease E inhibitor RraB n=1 Tax=Algoriella sp. TaxID=1872434 RepID=UPI001B121394|nr:ribonuclease E inhibitor RraB [Algoriella sp.]MBO6211657.1 ribonuclease E inhibitor RraB [Algoriella sp.]
MDLQSISNRDVLENLEKNGDNLSKAKEVFHWIYFKSENDRQNYIEITEKDNFVVVDKSFVKENDFPFSLEIKRVDKVDYEYIDDYTLCLWKLAKENNGVYDGWETSVEKD